MDIDFQIEEIDSIECIGEFEDEYVYDLSMKDETHTFIANDILVHNSNYVNFKLLVDSVEGINLQGKDAIDFCVSVIKNRFAQYLDHAFDEYAKSYNTKNQQEFKLENISDVGIFIAKKNYVLKPVYDGEAELHINKPKLKPKGVDMAKPSFPKFCREKQEVIINDSLMKHGLSLVHERDILPSLKSYRKAFALLQTEDLCFNKNLKEYEKYVTDDSVIFIPDKMPPGARAALYHNHLIEMTNIRKYKKLHGGDKIKFYHAKDDRPGYETMDIFAFASENIPMEFAPAVDFDTQFFKTCVESINKFLEAMGLQEITKDLKRDVIFVQPKKKNAGEGNSAIYPFFAVSVKTLEIVEIPAKVSSQFNPILEVEVPSEEYIQYISMFGIDTRIVPNCEMAEYMIKLEKDLDAKRIKLMDEDELLKAYEENKMMLENMTVSMNNAKNTMDVMAVRIKEETTAKNKLVVAELKPVLVSMKADYNDLKTQVKNLAWYDARYLKAAEKMREKKLKDAIEETDMEDEVMFYED